MYEHLTELVLLFILLSKICFFIHFWYGDLNKK